MSFWAQGEARSRTSAERRARQKRKALAAAGSRNKSWCLVIRCYIFCRLPRGFQAISHRRIRSSVLYRIVACGSLPQQNFDFGRRSDTPPCAQNDIQWRYAVVFFQNGEEWIALTLFLAFCCGETIQRLPLEGKLSSAVFGSDWWGVAIEDGV